MSDVWRLKVEAMEAVERSTAAATRLKRRERQGMLIHAAAWVPILSLFAWAVAIQSGWPSFFALMALPIVYVCVFMITDEMPRIQRLEDDARDADLEASIRRQRYQDALAHDGEGDD